jgi:ribosomal protein S18 acetylase RimI-like enzyme
MIKIRTIQPDDIPVAKRLIYEVAHEIFHSPRPLEESMAFYESQWQLHDMDTLQESYFSNDGIFLVMTNDDQIIGTGAIRKIDDEICELKRLWLLFEYHGKGLGYRMMQELLSFAREKGYSRIRLETDREYQNRAFDFYKRLGFYEIPRYSNNEDDIAMEMIL